MELITKEIMEKLKPLNATEGMDMYEIRVPLKLFSPCGAGTWYIWEWDGDNIMFGICDILEKEMGYVSLKELKELRVPPLGLGIERDISWDGNRTAGEIMNSCPKIVK